MIFRSWKHPYIARIGIFLIAVALVVGGLSCTYNLTMTAIPMGGGTPTPSSGSYSPGSVTIDPCPAAGYQFAYWTATAGTFTFSDNQPNNIFNQPTQDANVTVTAHFVRNLDHFKCYTVVNSSYIVEVVSLEDQFGTVNATVTGAEFFGNPAMKWHNNVTTPIPYPDHHLTVYNITTGSQPQTWQVEVVNQFGYQNLTVSGPVALAVPTWKLTPGNHTPPVGLDHFLLYKVIGGQSVNVGVSLQDEFDNGPQQSKVCYPIYFANPVQKTYDGTVTNITDPAAHLVFYEITGGSFQGVVVQVNNQFGNQTLIVGNPALLAVPSWKY
jgi:hypothetical protein